MFKFPINFPRNERKCTRGDDEMEFGICKRNSTETNKPRTELTVPKRFVIRKLAKVFIYFPGIDLNLKCRTPSDLNS